LNRRERRWSADLQIGAWNCHLAELVLGAPRGGNKKGRNRLRPGLGGNWDKSKEKIHESSRRMKS